jgi:hypothetical protein
LFHVRHVCGPEAWATTDGRYPSSVAAELDDARNRWLQTRKLVDPCHGGVC